MFVEENVSQVYSREGYYQETQLRLFFEYMSNEDLIANVPIVRQ